MTIESNPLVCIVAYRENSVPKFPENGVFGNNRIEVAERSTFREGRSSARKLSEQKLETHGLRQA
jgi:hypothetical protein